MSFQTHAAMPAAGPEYGGVPFWEAPLDAWDNMLNVGLRSHFMTTVLAMPLLIANQGLVVNISAAGAESYYLSVHYGVQKAGTDKLVQDMAYETRALPVTFISLWPGFVNTELTSSLDRPTLQIAYAAATRVKREFAARQSGGPVPPELLDDVQIESQRFPGKAIVALATDPNVRAKSGHTVTTVACALEYGYVDENGTIPDSFGFRETTLWKSPRQLANLQTEAPHNANSPQQEHKSPKHRLRRGL
jgi:dehydrogenase/reductase SDR family protein 1